MTTAPTYERTRARVETYFDRTATRTWERLTSDAPVSGVRATVRAGRDRMRAVMMAQLPADLTGLRVLDAGCGTGAMSVELAQRGAQVVAVDISPALIEIAQKRCPANLAGLIDFRAGDMFAPAVGAVRSHHGDGQHDLLRRAGYCRQPWRAARPSARQHDLYPCTAHAAVDGDVAGRQDVPAQGSLAHDDPAFCTAHCVGAARCRRARARLREVERVNSGFYISTALEFRP